MRSCGEPPAVDLQQSARNQAPAVHSSIRPACRWLSHAAAACLVSASFAAGWLGHAVRPDPTRSVVATQLSDTLTKNDHTVTVKAELAPEIRPATSSRSEPRPRPDKNPPRNRAPLVATVARVNIGRGDARAEVPILAGPGIDEEWLRRQPPPVSEHGQVVFERLGYQVDQQRRLITTFTSDGRRITIPIDQVLIRYAGNQSL
jgi:hypothetical protein